MCDGPMSYCDMWWRYVLQQYPPTSKSFRRERAECTKTMGGSSSPQSSCEKKEKEFSDRQKPLANIRTTTRIVIAAIIKYNVKNSLVHLERPLLSLYIIRIHIYCLRNRWWWRNKEFNLKLFIYLFFFKFTTTTQGHVTHTHTVSTGNYIAIIILVVTKTSTGFYFYFLLLCEIEAVHCKGQREFRFLSLTSIYAQHVFSFENNFDRYWWWFLRPFFLSLSLPLTSSFLRVPHQQIDHLSVANGENGT